MVVTKAQRYKKALEEILALPEPRSPFFDGSAYMNQIREMRGIAKKALKND